MKKTASAVRTGLSSGVSHHILSCKGIWQPLGHPLFDFKTNTFIAFIKGRRIWLHGSIQTDFVYLLAENWELRRKMFFENVTSQSVEFVGINCCEIGGRAAGEKRIIPLLDFYNWIKCLSHLSAGKGKCILSCLLSLPGRFLRRL